MSPWVLWLCLMALSGSVSASDVPFVFDQNVSNLASFSASQLEKISSSSSDLVGVPLVNSPLDNEILEIPITGGGSTPEGNLKKNVVDLKDELNNKVEPNDPRIHEDASMLASKYPGDHRIDQICEIYYYLKFGGIIKHTDSTKGGWRYVPDTRGIDSWNYANESLKIGDEIDCVGLGDCDDFAILMAAFVESIGGATRIILANNTSVGGHAYAEVYLGKLSDPNYQVEEIIEWLQQELNADKIYGHVDTDTKEAWLNLDWGPDEKGYIHPGGPLFQGNRHDVLRIRDKYNLIPLRLPEAINKAPRLISLIPDKKSPQEAGSVVTWKAKAKDPDNDPILYRFFLNGYHATKWINDNSWEWTTTEADIGPNKIDVYIIDNKHAGPNGFDSNKTCDFSITESEVESPEQETQSPDSSNPTTIKSQLTPNHNAEIGRAKVNENNGTDVVSYVASTNARGPSANYKTQRTVDSIKKEIEIKVDRGNELVRDEGLRLIGSRSGPQRIDQICSIYDYMVGNWTFVSDWKGLEQFQYANYTLEKGIEVGSSGKGDCDDFAILLASLIESIGGTPRIIFAYSPTGGHAYTEVYLGKSNSKEAERMLRWLRSSYSVKDVNVHVDPRNDDLWLNMDWWQDSGGAKHPGGPFYNATTSIPIYIQGDMPKTPLTPIMNLLPVALFSYGPTQPEAGEMVTFDASPSADPDGMIVDYEWDFGDGDTANGTFKSIISHKYSSGGTFQVSLTATDNNGDKSHKTKEIEVKEPLPEAIGTYFPPYPEVGQIITFDASQSKDKIGKIIAYDWDFDDGYAGKKALVSHGYADAGTYAVKLTVTNDKGVQNTSVINIVIKPKEDSSISTLESLNQQPVAIFSWDPAHPNPKEEIKFAATGSYDDGTIKSYLWSFGDGTKATGVTTLHSYEKGGDYTVGLKVTDDLDGINTTEVLIHINLAPHASFSFSPNNPSAEDIISFDASSSTSEDIIMDNEYKWDFGEGDVAKGKYVQHRFKKMGNYKVSLTVTDSHKLTDTQSLIIYLN
jgi:PKD repeat protein/transglutaminase-like putative cysteine protease